MCWPIYAIRGIAGGAVSPLVLGCFYLLGSVAGLGSAEHDDKDPPECARVTVRPDPIVNKTATRWICDPIVDQLIQKRYGNWKTRKVSAIIGNFK